MVAVNVHEVSQSNLPLVRPEHVRHVLVDLFDVQKVGQVQHVDHAGARRAVEVLHLEVRIVHQTRLIVELCEKKQLSILFSPGDFYVCKPTRQRGEE